MIMGWEILFLLYLLKYRANEAKDNIPDLVQEYLKRIK